MTETLFLTMMLDYPSIVQSNTCPMPNPSLDHVRDQNLSALIVVHIVVGKDTDTVLCSGDDYPSVLRKGNLEFLSEYFPHLYTA